MKKVLISDNYPLFRDFLKQKLSEEQIEIITTQENRDLYTKLITNLPNLLILDLPDDDSLDMEFLQKKLAKKLQNKPSCGCNVWERGGRIDGGIDKIVR